jgi:hypothetical protein
VKPSALVNPAALIGEYGISEGTKIPFGFQSPEDFFAEIRWVSGAMHIFTYELRPDVEKLFADILETAFDGKYKSTP